MSSLFPNPDNALSKAKDLAGAGKGDAALETLLNILSSKRYRQWQPSHEGIIFFYIELAVDLRKNVRDAFAKYKYICQESNVPALDKAVQNYLDLCEQKARDAKKKAEELHLDTTEDLEETPQTVMMQAVSGITSKDRKDQEILTPWVKYLWDGYRTILEVLRNNSKLQSLYQATARRAFAFCKAFNRPIEFRRLCEMLRKHLTTMTKGQSNTYAVDLQSAETQRLYLETRFEQLEVASQLELWQEAYRTIEDIYESMQRSSTAPKPTLMKTYYEKLAMIFWASENHLFHAYSLYKFYSLSQDGLDEEARKQLASAVVVASLAINPLENVQAQEHFANADNEENLRLAGLLGFKREIPSRENILLAIKTSSILEQASSETKDLHNLLEVKFGPLTLTKGLNPIFSKLAENANLSKYVEALKKVTVLRLLQQLSGVFKTIKIDRFRQLAPDMTFLSIERIIMETVKLDQAHVQVDHKEQVLRFCDEGMEADTVRQQLTSLAAKLDKIQQRIDIPKPELKAKERKRVLELVRSGLDKEHKEVFQRKNEIEQRKIKQEELAKEKERKDNEAKKILQLKKQQEEKQRLEAESQRREQQRVQREQELAEMKTKEKLVQAIQAKDTKGKVMKKIQQISKDIQNVDKTKILEAQMEVEAHRKQEVQRKWKEQAKRHDYLIRAMRLEEKSLLVTAIEEQKVKDKELAEAAWLKHLADHKAAHEKAVAEKSRLSRLQEKAQEFKDEVLERHRETMETKRQEREQKLLEEQEEQERQREAQEERRRAEEDKKREADLAQKRSEMDKKSQEAALKQKHAEKVAKEQAEEEEKKQRLAAKLAALNKSKEETKSQEEAAPAREPVRRDERREERQTEPPTKSDKVDKWRRDEPIRRDDGPSRRDDGPSRRDDGPSRRDDGPSRRDDGPSRRDDGPIRRDDGPIRRDDGPIRRDDGPIRRDDGPIRRDDGPIRRDDGPIRRDDGPRRFGPPDSRRAPADRVPERDWRQERPPRSDERQERPKAAAPAPKESEPEQAAQEDDGFTTVKKKGGKKK